jgi:hypothetical protein
MPVPSRAHAETMSLNIEKPETCSVAAHTLGHNTLPQKSGWTSTRQGSRGRRDSAVAQWAIPRRRARETGHLGAEQARGTAGRSRAELPAIYIETPARHDRPRSVSSPAWSDTLNVGEALVEPQSTFSTLRHPWGTTAQNRGRHVRVAAPGNLSPIVDGLG